MGFFGKVAAAGRAGAAINLFEQAYYEHRALDPTVEPYVFMVANRDILLRRAGKELIAAVGMEIAKPYGCLPSPFCIRMLAHHMCYYVIPEFSKTYLVNDWQSGMREVWEMYSNCAADRLNVLFKDYNPKSYEGFVTDHGERPFETKSMREYEERRLLLGLR